MALDFLKTLVVLAVLMQAGSSFALIELLEPSNSVVYEGQDLSLGEMESGQELTLVFYRKLKGFNWESFALNQGLFPSSWSYKIVKMPTNFKVTIIPSSDESIRAQRLEFTASSGTTSENFGFLIKIQKNLADLSLTESSKTINLGNSDFFELLAVNNSIAPQRILIESTLPSSWFKSQEAVLEANNESRVSLKVTPLVYGKKNFSFRIHKISADGKRTLIKELNSELTVQPSLKGKFYGLISGFPFYSIQLFPVMIFDFFLASFA